MMILLQDWLLTIWWVYVICTMKKWIFWLCGTKNCNVCICTMQFQSSVSVWYSIKQCLSFSKHRCTSQAQHFTLDWCLHSDRSKFCWFPFMAQSLQSFLSSTLIGQCPNCMFSLVKLLYSLLRERPTFFWMNISKQQLFSYLQTKR